MTPQETRIHWIGLLERLSLPLLDALSRGRLRAEMPVAAARGRKADRARFTHLEGFARLLCGISPWLDLPDSVGGKEEVARRNAYQTMTLEAFRKALDPASPDRMNFEEGGQPVVDAAFLSLAILRAPRFLACGLEEPVRAWLVEALAATRIHTPPFNNWLLFSATVEAALSALGQPWDAMRVDYALRQHEQWYKGDGAYGDGPHFHWDYYNSFVIQPMLMELITDSRLVNKNWEPFQAPILERARRYAAILERFICPNGTIPAIGRSLTYRCGTLHHLAFMALKRELPGEVSPAQVRCALTAVMSRSFDMPGTFDALGWLQPGFAGHQPGLAELYISTGSLYLCSTALLPLGLPPADPFWSRPDEPWTSQKIYSGIDMEADHAI